MDVGRKHKSPLSLFAVKLEEFHRSYCSIKLDSSMTEASLEQEPRRHSIKLPEVNNNPFPIFMASHCLLSQFFGCRDLDN